MVITDKFFQKIKIRACISRQGVLFYQSRHERYPLSGCGAVGSALDWGSRGREFKSRHSDQNVLMKDAAQKTPHESAEFSHIY